MQNTNACEFEQVHAIILDKQFIWKGYVGFNDPQKECQYQVTASALIVIENVASFVHVWNNECYFVSDEGTFLWKTIKPALDEYTVYLFFLNADLGF